MNWGVSISDDDNDDNELNDVYYNNIIYDVYDDIGGYDDVHDNVAVCIDDRDDDNDDIDNNVD